MIPDSNPTNLIICIYMLFHNFCCTISSSSHQNCECFQISSVGPLLDDLRERILLQSKIICFSYRIIPYHRIEVHAAFFFDGVAFDPSTEFGAVVAVVVVDETGFVVVLFAAETERVQIHHRAGFRTDRAERVVDVFRGTIAVRVQQGRHVLVAIRHVLLIKTTLCYTIF